MGRQKNPYRHFMQTMSISEDAIAFVKGYGGTLSKEPFYRRLDRLIADCKGKDTVQLGDTIKKQGTMIEYYLNKIQALEEEKQNQKLI